MKEGVLDVLMYLFETYIDEDFEPEPNRNMLRDELERAGFNDGVIDHALEWLEGLSDEADMAPVAPNQSSMRIYNSIERERVDPECRGYLLYLEQIGILSPPQRELVLDRLLALESGDIDCEDIKWVVLMVLFTQPGQEAAYARMEDLVFEDRTGAVH